MKKQAKQKLDPFFIFLQAHAFFQANEALYETFKYHPEKLYQVSLPACTLSSFACELFLKCLLCIETGDAPNGHHLRKLFDMLSESTRHRLEKLWDEYATY